MSQVADIEVPLQAKATMPNRKRDPYLPIRKGKLYVAIPAGIGDFNRQEPPQIRTPARKPGILRPAEGRTGGHIIGPCHRQDRKSRHPRMCEDHQILIVAPNPSRALLGFVAQIPGGIQLANPA